MTPQPFPLNQLGAMADKQNLACIAGTITSVYKSKNGENSNGPWSIQNIVLKGTDGTEITLWIKDREEIPNTVKGRFIILQAKQGEKGLSGLYVMDDDYNGKITRKIKVTPTCELSYQGGEPEQSHHGGKTQQAQQPNQVSQAAEEWKQVESQIDHSGHHEPTGEPPAKSKKQPAADSIHEAKKSILQIANLHMLCARAVVDYEAPAFKKATGQEMTESMQQGATASIFIESCRNGLHRNMPAAPLAD